MIELICLYYLDDVEEERNATKAIGTALIELTADNAD